MHLETTVIYMLLLFIHIYIYATFWGWSLPESPSFQACSASQMAVCWDLADISSISLSAKFWWSSFGYVLDTFHECVFMGVQMPRVASRAKCMQWSHCSHMVSSQLHPHKNLTVQQENSTNTAHPQAHRYISFMQMYSYLLKPRQHPSCACFSYAKVT
jgi:hypothetical protein